MRGIGCYFHVGKAVRNFRIVSRWISICLSFLPLDRILVLVTAVCSAFGGGRHKENATPQAQLQAFEMNPLMFVQRSEMVAAFFLKRFIFILCAPPVCGCPQRPEEGVGSTRAGITGVVSCLMCAENQTRVLWKSSNLNLLTSKAHQPPVLGQEETDIMS